MPAALPQGIVQYPHIQVHPVVVIEAISLHLHQQLVHPGWEKSWEIPPLLLGGPIGMYHYKIILYFTTDLFQAPSPPTSPGANLFLLWYVSCCLPLTPLPSSMIWHRRCILLDQHWRRALSAWILCLVYFILHHHHFLPDLQLLQLYGTLYHHWLHTLLDQHWCPVPYFFCCLCMPAPLQNSHQVLSPIVGAIILVVAFLQ